MPLTPGTRLGRYEVVRFIDAGGMGEVYLAKDERLEGEVTFKISSDGTRFLMANSEGDPRSAEKLVVVFNWFEELKHLVPAGEDSWSC